MRNGLTSEGVCRLCNKSFTQNAMRKHIVSCWKKRDVPKDAKRKPVFLLRAQAGPFFVYFDIHKTSTLVTLDEFLRDLWLECCNHLSSFHIDDKEYTCDDEREADQLSMHVPLNKVIRVGTQFSHEYDFGTTTVLELACISEMESPVQGPFILARNDKPALQCSVCKTEATLVCSCCIGSRKALMCKKCKKKHKCGEDILLPYVNSPRAGMCGFTGEDCRLINK
jgi:hypothetical protein